MDPVIRLHGKRFDFTVPLGFGRPTPAGGGPLFEEVPRPGNTPATVFKGYELVQMAVPVLLDGWGPPGRRRDMGAKVDQIIALTFAEDGNPPPSFVATGPFEFSGLTYRMQMPEWVTDEPKPILGPGGTVFRQALVLKLMEYQDPDDIEFHKGKKRRPNLRAGGAGLDQAEPLTTKILYDGETLQHVSARIYGNPTRAKEIGDVNGIRSPIWQGLRADTLINLPRDNR